MFLKRPERIERSSERSDEEERVPYAQWRAKEAKDTRPWVVRKSWMRIESVRTSFVMWRARRYRVFTSHARPPPYVFARVLSAWCVPRVCFVCASLVGHSTPLFWSNGQTASILSPRASISVVYLLNVSIVWTRWPICFADTLVNRRYFYGRISNSVPSVSRCKVSFARKLDSANDKALVDVDAQCSST